MTELRLAKRDELTVDGIVIEYRTFIGDTGQPQGVRLRVGGDRERDVTVYVGDAFLTERNMVRLTGIEHAITSVFSVGPRSLDNGHAAMDQPFTLALGACARLPTHQLVQLTRVGTHDIELFFTDKGGLANYVNVAFGFLREDDIVLRVTDVDRDAGTVGLMASSEVSFSRPVEAAYGKAVLLDIAGVAVFPDGLKLSLRRADHYEHGRVGWYFHASKGSDVNYPYGDFHPGKGRGSEDTFAMLKRSHTIRVTKVRTEPELAVGVRVTVPDVDNFELGEEVTLEVMKAKTGPDGLLLRFTGANHKHGYRMGADGQRIPFTKAWAGFDVVHGEHMDGVNADLKELGSKRLYSVLGFRLTILGLEDGRARVKLDRG